MIRTRLTEDYALATPFVSAGMGFLSLPPLAAAVSNAGGLGMPALGAAPPNALRETIRAARGLTSKPFGVDFIVETTAFGTLTVDQHIDVCIEEKLPVVAFFWKPPEQDWTDRLKAAGIRVWLQTGSVEIARHAVGSGVEVITAQGGEAGGHNQGTVGLFTPLPSMVNAVPVPVWRPEESPTAAEWRLRLRSEPKAYGSGRG